MRGSALSRTDVSPPVCTLRNHQADLIFPTSLVLSAPLTQELRFSEIKALYEQAYGDEKLITLLDPKDGVVDVRNVEGKHGWTLGGIQVHSEGKRVVVVGALDNLLKGAATQCLQVGFPCLSHRRSSSLILITFLLCQNLNLTLGYDEFDGIPL